MTTRIVVVGAGIAGYTAVEYLRKSPLSKEIKIIWVAPKDQFTYKPFWFDIISGYRKLNDYIFPLEKYCERFYIDFVPGNMTQLLPTENALILENGKRINYEYLILTTGSEQVVPTTLQSDHTFLFGTTQQVQAILAHLDSQFSAAKKQLSLLRKPFLSVVVTGTTLHSLEMLFAVYNYTELLRKKYDLRRNEIALTYITPEKQLGGDIPLKLSDIIEQYAKDHDIDVYIHQTVERVEQSQIVLNTGTIIDTYSLIAEGSEQFPQVYQQAHIKPDDFGGLSINSYLQLDDYYNVYAAGSLVNFYDWHKKERSWHSFNTAQAQAKVAAANVIAEIRGRNKEAYKQKALFELIPVNDQLAIGVYGDTIYFNNFMHYTRMILATKYLWQLTMPE